MVLEKQRIKRDHSITRFCETTKTKKKTRNVFDKFCDRNGSPLAIGDKVTLLSSGFNGKSGDIAHVVKFGTKFVVIKFPNGRTTTRKSKNLRLQ